MGHIIFAATALAISSQSFLYKNYLKQNAYRSDVKIKLSFIHFLNHKRIT